MRRSGVGGAGLLFLLSLALLAPGLAFAAVSAHPAASAVTRLGRAYRPGLSGFGQSRPRRIFLGGDPTGLVEKIHWNSWGGAEATGSGEAEYDWPGTAVAANPIAPGARVVAFHLGTCRGVRSYNAVEWYFPRYGGKFDPHQYINTCTGSPGVTLHSYSCADVTFADGAGKATSVITVGIACASAAPLIAALPVAEYLPAGGRFLAGEFRCGSEGAGAGGGGAVFGCGSGSREFSFSVEA